MILLLLSLGSFAYAAPTNPSATRQATSQTAISSKGEPAINENALIPIPEPSAASLILLGVGAGGLACMLRKRA